MWRETTARSKGRPAWATALALADTTFPQMAATRRPVCVVKGRDGKGLGIKDTLSAGRNRTQPAPLLTKIVPACLPACLPT